MSLQTHNEEFVKVSFFMLIQSYYFSILNLDFHKTTRKWIYLNLTNKIMLYEFNYLVCFIHTFIHSYICCALANHLFNK